MKKINTYISYTFNNASTKQHLLNFVSVFRLSRCYYTDSFLNLRYFPFYFSCVASLRHPHNVEAKGPLFHSQPTWYGIDEHLLGIFDCNLSNNFYSAITTILKSLCCQRTFLTIVANTVVLLLRLNSDQINVLSFNITPWLAKFKAKMFCFVIIYVGRY